MKWLKGAPLLSIFGFCLFKMFVSNKFLMARKGIYFLIFITETVQELKSSSDIYNKFLHG